MLFQGICILPTNPSDLVYISKMKLSRLSVEVLTLILEVN